MSKTTNEAENRAEQARRATAISPEMHGRRQIFTNEAVITDGNVIQVLNEALRVHIQNRAEEKYLVQYLRGRQPILDRVKLVRDEINNKVVVNIANQIVTFKTAEFAGEPIQYVSRGSKKSVPKKIEKLNAMLLTEGKQSKDMDLAYWMFTTGVGYRLVVHDDSPSAEFDEAPFSIYTPDPKNTFVVRLNDVSKRVVMGVTFVYLDQSKSQVRYTVYTDNVTYTIDGNVTTAGKIVSKTVHNFGMVTLIEYPCNAVYMGAFEVVLPLLDAINATESNRMDGVEQFIQAIMVFEGVDITRDQLLELKDLGALKIPPSDSGGSHRVYYLNEQLDQSQTQTLVDDLYQTVLQIVGMPAQGNAKTGDSSNNGAVIMKNGWWNAEARALETEAMWKRSETDFLKIILKICRQTNTLDGLAVSDVEPKFGRRSYEDKLVKTQAFTTLMAANVPPIQAYTISGMVTDPEAAALAYEAYQKEREDELNALVMAGGGTANTLATESASPAEEEEPGGASQGGSGGEQKEGGYAERVCPICGRRFKPTSGTQVYDRAECNERAKQMRRGQ